MIDHPVLSDEDRTPPPPAAEAARRRLSERRVAGDRWIKSTHDPFARRAADRGPPRWAEADRPSAGDIARRFRDGEPACAWKEGLGPRLREVAA